MFFGFQSFVYLKASVQGEKNPNPVQLMSNRGLFSNKLLPLKWSNVSSVPGGLINQKGIYLKGWT